MRVASAAAALSLSQFFLVAPAFAGAAVSDAPASSCALCDPRALVTSARDELERALVWELPQGGDPALGARLAAEALAADAQTRTASHLAKAAAAACVVSGGGPCVDTVVLLAALDAGVGEQSSDELLGLLSLAPGARLSASTCAEAATIRLRLAGRRGDPAWADACGPNEARQGELGYRAARAALLRGDLVDARARLDALKRAPAHAIRARYLAAVVDTADGRLERARDAFEEIARLPPDPSRSSEDDDARALAQLQLARLDRELGRPDLALPAYQSVAAGGPGRTDALVEGAAVAAFLGDHGLARSYLGVLGTSPLASRIEAARLKASLDLLDGDEGEARRGFAKLGALGRALRATIAKDRAELALATDPTLGGLLDARDGARLIVVEDALAQLSGELQQNARTLAHVKQILDDEGGPRTATRRALLRVREADLLLKRAEQGLSISSAGPSARIASTGALTLSETAVQARALRRSIDATLDKLERTCARERDQAKRFHDDVASEVESQTAALAVAREQAAPVLADLRKALIERARRVVRRLELAEETGALEIAWRKKVDASIEVKRLTVEHDLSLKDIEGQ